MSADALFIVCTGHTTDEPNSLTTVALSKRQPDEVVRSVVPYPKVVHAAWNEHAMEFPEVVTGGFREPVDGLGIDGGGYFVPVAAGHVQQMKLVCR